MPITIFGENLNINSWINDSIIDCGNSKIQPTDELLDFEFEIDLLDYEDSNKKLNNKCTSNINNYNIVNECIRCPKRFITRNNKFLQGNKKHTDFYNKSSTQTTEQKKNVYNRIPPIQKTPAHKKLHKYINTYYHK